MNVKTFLLLALVSSLSSATVKNSGVVLNLDYASQAQWQYAIQYESQCVFDDNATVTTKKTAISCLLKGVLSDTKDRLVFSIQDLNLSSELYDRQVQAQITEKLVKASPTLQLTKGFPSIDMTSDLSTGGIPEWNLYLQFAKLLPEMPQQAVKKGFTWERQATVPLKSARGTTECEMYRSFKIDSLSPAKNLAYISWQFKYGTTAPLADSASLFKYVPVAGVGSGSAVIDIAGKYIAKASVWFETPVAVVGKIKVNWTEKATLEYKSVK